MTRGETIQTKCHYKGSNDDFIIFIDDVDTYNKWKTDKTIPMAHFMSSFRIFQTNKYVLRATPHSLPSVLLTPSSRHGAQGQLDAAPKNILSAEFNTEDEDEVIKKILHGGTLQQSEVRRPSQRAHGQY